MIDDLYKEIILQYASHPLNKKLLNENSKNFYKTHQENTLCGDVIDLNIITDNNTISKIGWDGAGCVISQSSTSLMTEFVKKSDIKYANVLLKNFEKMMSGNKFDSNILGDLIGFENVKKFPMRIKCALLPWMGLKTILYEF
jgi:nitrogen fixation NifU-like protein